MTNRENFRIGTVVVEKGQSIDCSRDFPLFSVPAYAVTELAEYVEDGQVTELHLMDEKLNIVERKRVRSEEAITRQIKKWRKVGSK